ncbi:radical SAM protein [Paraclostridium bifermentans]|uniref:radical SAM protein n=1 Tax=Paraclostridium bifermentans TaxID=1490 RepID=UPI003D27B60D
MKFTIFLTRDCNLDCKYCYEGDKSSDYMSIETADKVINFIDGRVKNIPYLKKNKINIVLYGGEPLLNHKVLDYIVNKLDIKNEYNANFDMTTNGTIMNSTILNTLKKIDSVSVSIDGGVDIHNKNRIFKSNKGTFNVVKETIEKMISEGISIRARGTYNPQTCKYLYDSVDAISNLGVDCIVMHPDMSDENWNEQDFDIIFNQIKKMINDENLNKKCKHISLIDDYKFSCEVGSCFGGIADFAIDCNGDVYPCSRAVGFKEFLIGNVYNNNLNNEKINQLVKLNIDNDVCKGCSRINYCEGNRCKIINKMDTGDFFKPNGIICKFEEIELNKYKYIKGLKNKNDLFK